LLFDKIWVKYEKLTNKPADQQASRSGGPACRQVGLADLPINQYVR